MLLAPSQALLEQLEADRGESFGSWVFVVDLSKTSELDRELWLGWAVECREQELAQVLEWKEHVHLLLWTGSLQQDPPFVMPQGARAAVTFGTVVLHSGVGDEGLNWSGSALEAAMDLLERAPDCPGLWGDAPLAENWLSTCGGLAFDYQGEGYGYRGPASPAQTALAVAPEQDLSLPSACIVCAPLSGWGEFDWDHPGDVARPQMELDCPVLDWTNLGPCEAAFSRLQADCSGWGRPRAPKLSNCSTPISNTDSRISDQACCCTGIGRNVS